MSMTTYQYLFCATCGVRRTGHAYRCSVCNGLLRRAAAPERPNVFKLQSLVRSDPATAEPRRQALAA